jgi:tripartite-type tricarboxylate transporter receptor subunit TctC
VDPSFPAKTVPEFIAFAKLNPRSGELFKMMSGINLVHVPYLGGGQALIDLLGGRVQVFFSSLPSSTGYVRAGNLRPLR